MKRVAAQWVISSEGRLYQRHYVEQKEDGSWSILPLEQEMARTVFINGILVAASVSLSDLMGYLDQHKKQHSCFDIFFQSLRPYLSPLERDTKSLFYIEPVDLINRKLTSTTVINTLFA